MSTVVSSGPPMCAGNTLSCWSDKGAGEGVEHKTHEEQLGLLSLEKKEALGRPHCSQPLSERKVWPGGAWFLLPDKKFQKRKGPQAVPEEV